MHAQVKFCVESFDGSELGKLSIPLCKTAQWINFLVSPKQQAQIVSAEQSQDKLILYFQAHSRLYAYLNGLLNCQIEAIQPETTFVGHSSSSSNKRIA